MKRKILLFAIILLFCLSLLTAAYAGHGGSGGSSSESGASAASSLTLNTDSQVYDINYPNISKLDSSSVAGLQPIWDSSVKGEDSLPPDLKEQRYKIYKGAPENILGIPLHMIRDGRKGSLYDDTINYKNVTVVDALSGDPDDRIVLLEYWPWGAEPVATSKVTLKKHKYNIERAKFEALAEGLKASKKAKLASGEKNHNGARFCVLLHNFKHDTENGGYGFGGTILGGKVLENSGKDLVAGAGGGSGFGHFKSYIWPDPTYKAVFFNKYISFEDSEKFRSAKKQYTSSINEKRKIEIVRCPHVQFDQDSDIVKEDQMLVIACMDEKIRNEPLGQFQYWSLTGSASEEGSNNYNLLLGDRRVKAVNLILARMALERGETLEWVLYRIRHNSKGELFPNYEEKVPPGKDTESKNREVYLVKVTDDTLRGKEK